MAKPVAYLSSPASIRWQQCMVAGSTYAARRPIIQLSLHFLLQIEIGNF
jgi:hypothetical protein